MPRPRVNWGGLQDGREAMLWYKACPRCESGDVALDRDFYGWYVACLQCGYMKDFRSAAEARAMLQRREGERELMALPA